MLVQTSLEMFKTFFFTDDVAEEAHNNGKIVAVNLVASIPCFSVVSQRNKSMHCSQMVQYETITGNVNGQISIKC